jgi:hypothetical protein
MHPAVDRREAATASYAELMSHPDHPLPGKQAFRDGEANTQGVISPTTSTF